MECSRFYDKWNVQGFILLSLSLQIVLVLFAPFRKRTRSTVVLWIILAADWVAYWVATFAIGLIFISEQPSSKPEILASWASFLLLHLGASDTIPAFALDDSALWLKHLVRLAIQVAVTGVIFARSLPNNKLWIPTFIVFSIGTIKNVECICALYLANRSRIRESLLKEPDPGPDYAVLMEEFTARKEDNFPTYISSISPSHWLEVAFDQTDKRMINDLDVVEHAYEFFKVFKALFVNFIFSFHELDKSLQFFLKRNSKDALKVLAVELNFIYGVLHTKDVVVHSRFGSFVRIISWYQLLGAFLSFCFMEKDDIHEIDVRITYTLFVSAIGLDTIALLKLFFSDWAIASIQKFLMDNDWTTAIAKCFFHLLNYFLVIHKIKLGMVTQPMSCFGGVRQILFRRWSESLYTYNLIDYCLKECPKAKHTFKDYLHCSFVFVIKVMGLKEFYERIRDVSKKQIEEHVWHFIFIELEQKCKLIKESPETAKMISSARGNQVLQNFNDEILLSYVDDLDYDQSIIIWHIATDLLYRTNEANNINSDHREISKILSDYMLYLLVIHPTMMSNIASIAHTRFRDNCAETKNFFTRKDLGKKSQECRRASEVFLEVNTEVEPISLKGEKSKSVLFDAAILAKKLKELPWVQRWELMAKVWVELLSYAASHCGASTHAAQLHNGGEFITFVWLQMVHFGMGDYFQIYRGSAKTVRLWVLHSVFLIFVF